MKHPCLLVVADVGGSEDYHLGDEAMLEANLETLRRLVPFIEFTVPSRDPAWTSARYNVRSILAPKIESFETNSRGWCSLLGVDLIRSMREADGLFISGGGNLCETWPGKVLERVAFLEYAAELGKPSALVGQTLGPSLNDQQHRLLSHALPLASWIGVRESSSARLAAILGVRPERLRIQLDDAYFLLPVTRNDPTFDDLNDALRGAGKPWILVTLDASFAAPDRKEALVRIASQLDALAVTLKGSVIFVPHVGGSAVGPPLNDAGAGRRLADSLQSPIVLLGLWKPREVRWLIQEAALVISTRYHPVVFATAAGVPALGIHTDDYTRTKLRGALAPAGLENWSISVSDAERGFLFPLTLELCRQRESIRSRLGLVYEQSWPKEVQRWKEICAGLRLHSRDLPRETHGSTFPKASKGVELMPHVLGEEEWAIYERQGYLRLGLVLAPSRLAAIRDRMDAIMLGRIRTPGLQMQLDTGGKYEDLPEPVEGLPAVTLGYRKVQGLEADPLVLDLIRNDLFREICARHYGKHASISTFRVMLMNKPAGKGTYLPWHQDAGDVWKLDRDPLVTIWIALDRATVMNGCIQVIAGSHK